MLFKVVRILALAGLVFSAPSVLSAQGRSLPAGSLLRVEAPSHFDGKIEGKLVSYTAESIILVDSLGSTHNIPTPSVTGIALYEGVNRKFSTKWGAMFGGFLGASIGAVGGPFTAIALKSEFGRQMAINASIGLVSGSAIGATMGAIFAKERWQPYRIQVKPALSVREDGTRALSFTIPVR